MRKNLNKNSEKSVALIISSYNQKDLLVNFISTLSTTRYRNYKIYFVDDSGMGDIGKAVKKKFPKVKVIINKENLGCSKSYNKGIKMANKEFSPDYFLLLNDDLEVADPNWLKKIIDVMGKFPKVGIAGCRIIYPDGSMQWVSKEGKVSFYNKSGTFGLTKEMKKNQIIKDVMGCCFLIRRNVVEKIGLWDEGFSPAYGEESDYCFRATKKGFGLMYIGETEIIHYGASSAKTLNKDWIWFLKKRNAIRMEWKNYSLNKIFYYFFVHFFSIFKRDGLSFFRKIRLLFLAYIYNIKKSKEIMVLRKQ
jgi:GT2 family glycosyltransferase